MGRKQIAATSVRELGFTIFELIITMSLFAIISLMAAPRVSELLDSFSKRNAEMQVLQDMRLAQATTVEQGCNGIFNIAAGGNSYTFGCDYVPYSAAVPPVYDKVLLTRVLPQKVVISADAQIMFNSKGQAIESTGALTTRTLSLKLNRGGTLTTFNIGTLRPTGFFSYMN